jgi:hypothetical protein
MAGVVRAARKTHTEANLEVYGCAWTAITNAVLGSSLRCISVVRRRRTIGFFEEGSSRVCAEKKRTNQKRRE